MKKINIIIAGCLALGASTLASCGSDYLNTTPTESIGTATAVGTADNAYKALNGIAKTMSTQQYAYSQGCAGENRIISIYENYASQNYLYNAFASGWGPIMNLQYSQRNNTTYAAYPYNYYYNIIGQANSIICNIDKASGEESLKNFDKAAALTFRAYAYEKLLHYYAPRWQDSDNGAKKVLPLRIDESTGDLAPSSMSDTYAQIYKDCEEAISLFEKSGYKRGSAEVWIPNVNVAHAVYARAALTRQDYKTALTQATAAREGYPLMSNADYQAGFCKPTSEWIMGSYGDATENLWYWSYGTQFSANGYYASNTWYGSGQMNDALSRQIPNTDVRKHLFLTPDKIGWSDDQNIVELDYPKNPEKEPQTLEAYVKAYNYIDSIHQAYTSSYPEPYLTAKPTEDNKAFLGILLMGSQWKFFVYDSPGVGYLPFIRSSEMLLIEAEANYFLKNEKDAQDNLVELNATSGRDPEYTCEKTGEDLLKEIQKYRELELWGEGFEFSDLKRWNLPIDRTTGNNIPTYTKVLVKANDPNWIWATPQNETDYNHGFDNTQDPNGK